ncbi:cell cycle arrest protein BUB2 [Entomortierella parvispora]|uniref:Cell cycle arrest protein BUB2 n=1 Tax=Entomortierella parvispora TaxID=205924 RepID=A0A9P3HLM4_9FUNG|nr:cell cycle arrest protein BUB2 [Entomortierella parvispora]
MSPHSHLSPLDNSILLLDSTTATDGAFVPHSSDLPTSTEPQVALDHRRLSNRIQKLIRIPLSVSQTHSRMGSIRLGLGGRAEKRRLAAVTSPSTPSLASPDSGKVGSKTAVAGTTAAAEAATPYPADNSTTRSSAALPADSVQQEIEYDDDNSSTNREGFTVALSLFAKVKARVLNSTLHPVSSKISTSSNNSGSSSGADSGTHEGSRRLDRRGSKDASRGSRDEDSVGSLPGIAVGNSSDADLLSQGVTATRAPLSSAKPTPPPLLHSDSGQADSGHIDIHHPNDQSSIHTDSTSCHDPMDGQDIANDSESTVTDLDESASRLRLQKYVFEDGPEAIAVLDANGSMTTPQDNSTLQVVPTSEGTDAATQTAPSAAVSLPLTVVEDEAQDPLQLFQEVLTRRHQTEDEIADSLHDLRRLILAYGIPTEPAAEKTPGARSKPSIRAKCWKLLLEVHHVSAQEYVSLVKQGKPEEYGKIRNDTFRTMATDKKFLDVVEEDSLIRVLCAFSWSTQATSYDESGVSFTYVQGMNVLAAPFLYTMAEMDAFYSYSNFIKQCCPLYVQPTLDGVHCGIKLLEECLCKIDPELYDYLKSKRMSAELYAFPSVLTICACTPPLDQVMQLWDFLLSWGIHLNIICIIAQLHSIRNELMSHASPMRLLRIFPDLDADRIIGETIRMVKLLPDELYDLLVRHPYDPSVVEQISW